MPAAQGGDDDSSSTPWGWIIAAVILVLAIIAGILLARRRAAAKRAESMWRTQGSAALDTATSAEAMLIGIDATSDAAAAAAVAPRIDEATAALDRLAAAAPDDAAAALSRSTGEAMRALMFAIEADAILRSGPPPTADQLADADRTRRTREAELAAALDQLRTRVHRDEQVPSQPTA